MELVDVVDMHDNIVSTVSRDEVHRKGLLHRGVTILVFDPGGRLFVQQRSSTKDVFPSTWQGGVMGHVMHGETLHEAAVRELREELGLVVVPAKVKEVARFGLHEGVERMLGAVYVLRDVKQEPVIDKGEVSSGGFWAVQKVESEVAKNLQVWHPIFVKTWQIFKDAKQPVVDYVGIQKK
ncbi:NUDIX domain-containing protein [Candidatus Woesearchaeota archaeon]|nr:NUDIX domain-containing protein [Candidatus Woesearchaeota archaeon]